MDPARSSQRPGQLPISRRSAAPSPCQFHHLGHALDFQSAARLTSPPSPSSPSSPSSPTLPPPPGPPPLPAGAPPGRPPRPPLLEQHRAPPRLAVEPPAGRLEPAGDPP